MPSDSQTRFALRASTSWGLLGGCAGVEGAAGLSPPCFFGWSGVRFGCPSDGFFPGDDEGREGAPPREPPGLLFPLFFA
jgi:hypothetical protein